MKAPPFTPGDLLAIIAGMAVLYIAIFACGYYEGYRTRPAPPPIPMSEIARDGFKGQIWDDPSHMFSEVAL